MSKLKSILLSIIFTFLLSTCNINDNEKKINKMISKDSIISELNTEVIIDSDEENIHEASYHGGNEALQAYIANNKWIGDKLSAEARKISKKEKIIVRFNVDENGKISAIVIANPDDILCDICKTEAARLVKSMPDWDPCYLKTKDKKNIYSKSIQAIEIEL